MTARICAECDRETPVMVEMSGASGAWFLCARCWREGAASSADVVIEPIVRRDVKPPNDPEPERTSEFRFTGKTGTYVPDDDGFW